jgi:hypothetical protein
MSSTTGADDSSPYTIPYSGSSAVTAGGIHVSSAKAVGDSCRTTTKFPIANQHQLGRARPCQESHVLAPATAKSPSRHTNIQEGRPHEAPIMKVADGKPTSKANPGSVYTGSTATPFYDSQHPRFQQQPNVPQSEIPQKFQCSSSQH